ncbi:nitrogenase-stabilizing/protective protein NifW [Desertifilum sp. FACHB-1129]|uniref:Nitrogenase-stabilizing/protective protein NifW n=2 Tax=Desertifilum tharense IPPAS B-1220 TaxID=1781255 RepID=A0A1E5QEV3_9CYAN|nr:MULTISPECIES: nitrogenase-stabilizing/protective protein NifW [Desertifilum]MDA0212694.1 nitrogenase-stabilizing/protective protein NifW [Cyanobacteria bacterium FC1]MBD2313076.1 nitrogenase-stabilizing/protective protein NifW [Desertifilum sp. FACHB-1129]MBD2324118.1 nitrogenase-stabilizing/protective protein NifW [Desertifilum sp. FACHB-866]MBD2334053.1 nitrogenase-stabilizing/protective protein NifW [Desertifilum sp. FACHB-868]OEJ73137.1 nitrogenase stabilizing/protective protein [Desert
MSVTLAEFNQLTDAEQYFAFFDLPYDATIVNVNRLHILQKFSQLIQEIDIAELSETQILEQYRLAFQQAYSLFLTSNSLEQKLFKVFQKKSNNLVLLEDIGSE